MTLPYYDYNNCPAHNPAPLPSNSQPGAPPAYQASFDYSKYNGPVCFPGGQPFNPSQSQAQPQQQRVVHSSGGPTTFTYTSGTPSADANVATLHCTQPTQGQRVTEFGQLVQIAGQSQPCVVVRVMSDGTFYAAPTQ